MAGGAPTVWRIRPHEEVGDLDFGTAPAQVAACLGASLLYRRATAADQFGEWRHAGPISHDLGGRLTDVEFFSMDKPLALADIDVFGDDPRSVIRHLERLNGSPILTFETCRYATDGVTPTKWIDVKRCASDASSRRPPTSEASASFPAPPSPPSPTGGAWPRREAIRGAPADAATCRGGSAASSRDHRIGQL